MQRATKNIGVANRRSADAADDETARRGFATSLTRALIESRQRYKDLVELSSEFAWETDASGRFVFVSPAGALGHEAEELVGRCPREFRTEGDAAVFAAAEPQDEVELGLRRADGSDARVLVTAAPVFAADGAWCGARGIWRDVTDERARERELALARSRERLVTHLLRTMRDEVDPEKALAAALEATTHALAADGAIALHSDGGIAARWGVEPDAEWIAAASVAAGAAGEFDGSIADRTVLGDATRHRGRANGAVLFWREPGAGGFARRSAACSPTSPGNSARRSPPWGRKRACWPCPAPTR